MKIVKHLYVPISKETARIIFQVEGKIVAYQTTGKREFEMIKAMATYKSTKREKKEVGHHAV